MIDSNWELVITVLCSTVALAHVVTVPVVSDQVGPVFFIGAKGNGESCEDIGSDLGETTGLAVAQIVLFLVAMGCLEDGAKAHQKRGNTGINYWSLMLCRSASLGSLIGYIGTESFKVCDPREQEISAALACLGVVFAFAILSCGMLLNGKFITQGQSSWGHLTITLMPVVSIGFSAVSYVVFESGLPVWSTTAAPVLFTVGLWGMTWYEDHRN